MDLSDRFCTLLVAGAVLALILLLSGAGSRKAAAQVNIEPFSLGQEETGWDVRVGANFKMESNETVLLEIDLTPRVEYAREAHSVAAVGNVEFSERAGSTFRNLFLLHTRYLYRLGSALSIEGFMRVQRDEFALLNSRLSGGGGLRFQISSDERAATYGGLAVGVEAEQWDVDPDDFHPESLTDPRTYGYLAYRLNITESTTLLNTLSGSLRLAGDLDDGRIADTATLQVEISDQVALTSSFGLAYDSRPPESQPEVSMALKNGLTLTF